MLLNPNKIRSFVSKIVPISNFIGSENMIFQYVAGYWVHFLMRHLVRLVVMYPFNIFNKEIKESIVITSFEYFI